MNRLFLIVMCVSLLASCTPGEKFKSGDKIYEVKDVYVLVDTVSLKELKDQFQNDEVKWKKVRNEHVGAKPFMWRTFTISPGQFYKRSTASVGKVIGFSGEFCVEKFSSKHPSEFYEIELDKDIKLTEDKDSFGDPNRDDNDPLAKQKNVHFRVVPNRIFMARYYKLQLRM